MINPRRAPAFDSYKQRVRGCSRRKHARSRARLLIVLAGDEGVRDDNPTLATGSYNGNQGKDDYRQYPSSLSLSLSFYHASCVSRPLSRASWPCHTTTTSFTSSLHQPPFKLNRSLALHFPLLNLATSRLSEYRGSIILARNCKSRSNDYFPVLSRNERENYTEHPLRETISNPSLFN